MPAPGVDAGGIADALDAWVAEQSRCGGVAVLDDARLAAFQALARHAEGAVTASGADVDVQSVVRSASTLGSVLSLVAGRRAMQAAARDEDRVGAATGPMGAANAADVRKGAAGADTPPHALAWLSKDDVHTLLTLTEQLSAGVIDPPEWLHDQSAGASEAPPSDSQHRACCAHAQTAAACMQALAGLCCVLRMPCLMAGLPGASQGSQQDQQPGSDPRGGLGSDPRGGHSSDPREAHGSGRQGGASCVIEELDGGDAEHEESARRATLLAFRMTLVAATYAHDGVLPSPWLPPGASAAAAAQHLLQTVADLVSGGAGGGSASSPPSGSAALMSREQQSVQAALGAMLPQLLPPMRRALVAAQPHAGLIGASVPPSSVPSEVAALITPVTSTFQRGVAARRMAWLVRATRHPFIGPLVPVLLPAILGMLDDASASVSVFGVHALHHLSAEALPADLLYQRDLLLDTCRRMVAGCEERLWPSVLPATIRTVQATEGRDPCAAGYHMLATELLTEAERCFHVKARRLPLLRHLGPLVLAMSLTTTRHLSRLMPLLLEALHAFDAPSRAAASGLVLCVARATWERLGAHAAILWQHLLSAFCRDVSGLLTDGQAAEESPGKAGASGASRSDCEQPLPGAPAAVDVFQLSDRLLRQQPCGERGGGGGRAAAGAPSHDAACAEELARNVFLSCQLLAAFGDASMWDSVGSAAGDKAMLGGSPPAAGALRAYMCSLRPSNVPGGA